MRDSPGAQWFHYTLWEDWHAGLYGARLTLGVVEQAATMLRDTSDFAAAMTEVGQGWPVATTHNLSNEYRNHRPWLGRSAACFRYTATIPDTNMAWSMLTLREQADANHEADLYCWQWRSANLRGQLRFAI